MQRKTAVCSQFRAIQISEPELRVGWTAQLLRHHSHRWIPHISKQLLSLAVKEFQVKVYGALIYLSARCQLRTAQVCGLYDRTVGGLASW
jgi:hypothetical protein